MTIFNPNPTTMMPVREADDETLSDLTTIQPQIRVRNKNYFPDPDLAFERMMGVINTKVVGLDAKILEAGFQPGKRLPKYAHFKNLQEFARSPIFRRRVKDHFKTSQLKEAAEVILDNSTRRQKDLKTRLKEHRARRESQQKELREHVSSDSFVMGSYPDEAGSNSKIFGLQDTFLPSTNSPYSKQMLWVDYQLMHRQCFEASTKNPLAKRIVKIIPQFVLGRSVVGTIKDQAKQQQWNEFYKRNRMKLRLKQILRELITFGEVFNRYFLAGPKKLAIRSIDPSTIWDIVTNPDDLEDVYYYHQQYMIAMNSPIAAYKTVIPSTLVIRQIPANQIDHFKINAVSSEKRGRSELYAILGWLIRYKEFMNDRVLLNKMRAMFALDVKVTGGVAEVNAANDQFSTPPGPGAVVVHNESVEIDFKNANTGASEATTDAEMLLKIIAIGAGVSENFLGVARQQSRAGALISTEPDVKNFEDYQEIMEELLSRAADRTFALSGDHDVHSADEMEFTFPSIAAEERSAKLKDIALSESMDWFSKERASTMAAKEFQITTYDRKKEETQIKKERNAPMEAVISAPYMSFPKVPQFPSELAMQQGELFGEDPNIQDPNAPEAPAGEGGAPEKSGGRDIPHMSASMGFPPDTGGRNLPNTKAKLNRPGFTRGGEKAALKGNKSSGAKSKGASSKLRASGMTPGRGWSTKAREAAIAARRLKRDRRLAEQQTKE